MQNLFPFIKCSPRKNYLNVLFSYIIVGMFYSKMVVERHGFCQLFAQIEWKLILTVTCRIILEKCGWNDNF